MNPGGSTRVDLDEIRQACFAQLRSATSSDEEWRKHLDWASDRLSTGPGMYPLTPADRIYIDALAVAGIQRNDIPSVRAIVAKTFPRDPDDFFLIYLDAKLSNLLGIESESRERLMNLLEVEHAPLDVPGFEFVPPGLDQSPDLSIVVSTWNRRDSLSRLFESIRRNTIGSFELLVYDNQSTDGTIEFLRMNQRGFPELGVAYSQGHRSTIRAYKLLFQLAHGGVMGALADDVEVLPGWDVGLCAEAGRLEEIGEVTPLVLSPDGTLRHTASCVPYMSLKNEWMNSHGLVPNRRGARPEEAGLPPDSMVVEGGAYPFVRREVFMRTSMVDGRYLHVWDNDLALEIRSLGLTNRLVTSSWIMDHTLPSKHGVHADETMPALSELLFVDPRRALHVIQEGSSPPTRYFHDDLLHQCKWSAWRINPCNL